MNPWLKIRLGLVFLSFAAFFSLVSFRLVQLQLLPDDALDNLSKKQFTKTDKRAPFRLPIFDRNHEELAVSIPVSSLYAHPKKVPSRKRVAQVLAKHLGGNSSKWLQKLDPQKNFVWLQRQINEEKATRIKELKIPGLGIESENKRIYPNGSLAAHSLGFTDIDGNGLAGIELTLNEILLQEAQKSRIPKDGKGNTSYIENTSPTKTEASLELTLDRRIQSLVEQELEKAKTETKARSVMAVVMDPNNGEILAIAQRPSFDPNFTNQTPSDNLQNRVTQALYEPGSTMKVLFAAEALERGLLTRDSLIDCGNGKIKVGKTTISEAESSHRHAKLTLEKVLAYSSNIGAVRIAQMIGSDGAKDIISKFGLDQKTGIETGGEATSQPKSADSISPLLISSPRTASAFNRGDGR
ncbi:MAG: penicillin-binding protein 2 [Proteobacteria bacterium]|nr:penicillin-binding protein 2 [Pseudomonadota bacterium]